MKILVISDTHGSLSRFWEVFEKLKKENPPSAIVHCGDYYRDADEIRRKTGLPVFAVRGNCDGDFSDNGHMILETEAGSFLITHGHMLNVKYSLQRLYYKTLEAGCIGAFFGHTHRKAYLDMDGIYLMNPGSLTQPRDGSGGTFGMIEASGSGVWGKIYHYDDFMAFGADKSRASRDNSYGIFNGISGGSRSGAVNSGNGGNSGESESSEEGGISAKSDKNTKSGVSGKSESDAGPRGKTKITGGKLRKLLNYSDKF